MSKQDLREIIVRVLDRMHEESDQAQAPTTACVYGDGGGCDMTTLYAVGEEG